MGVSFKVPSNHVSSVSISRTLKAELERLILQAGRLVINQDIIWTAMGLQMAGRLAGVSTRIEVGDAYQSVFRLARPIAVRIRKRTRKPPGHKKSSTYYLD